MVSPKAKRKALEATREKHSLSIRQSCKLLGLHQSTYFHRSKKMRDDLVVASSIKEIASQKVRYGRPRITWFLRERLGFKDNHKRIARIYRELGLQVNKRLRKRRILRDRILLEVPSRSNQLWAMDFVLDSFSNGRRFRVLTMKDLFTQEAVVLYVDTSITGDRVADALEQLKQSGRLPQAIVCDNGSEFISKAMDQWAYKNGVTLKFIQPGKPTQNAFIESFNGKFRDECLNQHWFEGLAHAKEIIEAWRIEYNTERPNSTLKNKTPIQFAKEQEEKLYA